MIFKRGVFMKNFSKFFGITALAAVIVLGMVFTGCDVETTFTFTNETEWSIIVTSSELDPSSFTLAPLTNIALPADTKTAVAKKSSAKYSYQAGSFSVEESKRQVIAEQSGTGVVFKKNENQGLADIKLDQE
jgi:hypothetical protein